MNASDTSNVLPVTIGGKQRHDLTTYMAAPWTVFLDASSVGGVTLDHDASLGGRVLRTTRCFAAGSIVMVERCVADTIVWSLWIARR